MYAATSVGGALGTGLISFYLGMGLTAFLRSVTGHDAWDTQMCVTIGWVFGVLGWILGIGMWGSWAREWFGLSTYGRKAPGWQRYFTFCTDHKVIGVQYLVTFAIVFLSAGLLAMLMRVQLAQSDSGFLSNSQYNAVMTLHGIMMVAVAVAAVIGGFGNFAVPIMIGADDMAFPRLNALSYWLLPPVAISLLATPFLGGLDHGWTAYPPLSSAFTNSSQVLFDLAIITFGLTSILSALNFLVTIIFMRAPGMTWGRLPIFVWSMFITAWIALLYTQGFAVALLMVLLDRVAGLSFFNAAHGGDPLLYQHVFWFYSHPAVYIMVLPGFGLTLEILAHFSRKPLFAYRYAVGGLLGILGLSGVVWAHHMFTSGMPNYLHGPFLVMTELISIPTGLIFLSALGTIWMGKLWLRPPMLFALAVIFNFACGGVTGIFLADVPTDIHLHDTYFVVAHFHYTIVGGEIFALFAGIYYWFPKITGRMYNEKLAHLHFWWMFVGFNITFFTMHLPGIEGMNRRIASYPDSLQNINLFVSIAAFFMGASFLVFVYNFLNAWIRGPRAEANPWKARTLEWQVSSPPPLENFPTPPVVQGHPYDYGVPGSVHGVFPGVASAPASGGGGGGGA